MYTFTLLFSLQFRQEFGKLFGVKPPQHFSSEFDQLATGTIFFSYDAISYGCNIIFKNI